MAISYKIIGKHLRAARKAKGFTQEQTAEKMGFSAVHYGRLERGERHVNLPVLAKLSELFCTPLEQLLVGCIPDAQSIIAENSPEARFLDQMNRYVQRCSEETLERMLRVCEALAAEEMDAE